MLAHHAPDHLDQRNRSERLWLHTACLVVVKEILDELLQGERVLPHDAHDLLLLNRQLAADAVAQ